MPQNAALVRLLLRTLCRAEAKDPKDLCFANTAGAAKSKGGKEAEAAKKEAEKAAAEFKDAEAAASTGHDSTKVGEIDKVRSKLRLYSS